MKMVVLYMFGWVYIDGCNEDIWIDYLERLSFISVGRSLLNETLYQSDGLDAL
jgi:hypothetical protein